nr:hypothetical protein pSH111_227_57 [Salmonella enterica subsp. enterica serovar Heidelberg]AKG90242.1 hypothetical protein [Salmonella enterica subsp. enterica serovar Typhimurium]AKJ19337.1 hypothetical protein [Enterobacter cloacae]AKT72459.1 hypothetical protein [Escherichia coli]ASO63693.1 hypothetical protein [Citrobacter freundii]AUF80512.1 Hypothetical protein [Raoultella ornithinolytica]QIM10952.1 hypothetical protein [Leclercia sp.]QJR97385.1 hypothetical protein [Salmonella sp.]
MFDRAHEQRMIMETPWIVDSLTHLGDPIEAKTTIYTVN